jgi:branched-chain amino acid transport system ATP-binding protein
VTALLRVASLDVCYGDFQAIHGVTLAVRAGETLAVIGANGAGKSTLLKAVAGVLRPAAGAIVFDGSPVDHLPAHRRVRLGVALVPEGRHIFPSLSVAENLRVGAYAKRPGRWNLASVYDLFPLVGERRDRLGRHLSGGEQQAVAIGRALMSNPRLLLLDEVSLGLAPAVVGALYDAIPKITAAGTAVLLVEQDLNQALRVADRVQCLLEGRTVLEAAASAVNREQVAAAYFGI